jgi:dTDP-4-amino-4,6-dideoxygalactose transaminase
MKKNFITFGSPLITKNEIREVVHSLKTGWLGTGPKVIKFEKEFSKYKKAKYSAAVNSCTAALHLSLLTLNLKKNDEVITSALTFCSTVNSIIHSGAKPVLVDVDYKTQNIDPSKIEDQITPKTKAIIVVHFAGRPCDMDEIIKIVKKYNLFLIEDCAHAIESKYKGISCGNFGDFGCFSFYATKNLVTGEGGMLISNSIKKISKAKILGLHGLSKDAWKRFSDKGFVHYDVVNSGFKYNMMDLQAAIGIHQLKKINENHKKREKIWSVYNENFKDLNIGIPSPVEKHATHAYHLYTLQINKKDCGIDRDSFIEKMQKKNIGTGIHYRAIPEYTFYKKKFKWKIDNYPNAKKIGRETVSIPISPKIQNNELNKILKVINNIIKKKRLKK